MPVEIREFLEAACHQSGTVDSADSSDESVSGGDATPQVCVCVCVCACAYVLPAFHHPSNAKKPSSDHCQDPDQVEEKEPDAEDSNDKDAAEGQNGFVDFGA